MSVQAPQKRHVTAAVLKLLLLFVAALAFFSARWYVDAYGNIGFDSILFTLTAGLEGTQSDLIFGYLLKALLPALIAAPLLNWGIGRLSHRGWILAGVSLVLAVTAACSVGLPQYIWDNVSGGQLFEKRYVEPDSVEITFPEKKRNLVYILMESMETSYLSRDLGGALEENRIPELYQLAKNNTNFSHNSDVGGFREASGAAWTVGSMVSQTAGIPLKTPSGNQNDYGQDGSPFLPGVRSINNILHENGYYQTLMVGSDANFGGRKSYFLTHNMDHVYDVYTARKDGIIPNDYFVWWGMEDLHLFEYAKQELTKIAQAGQPFAFSLLTVDTHHIGGYQCSLCRPESDEPYECSIACSSRQVTEFVLWLQQQPFYENTTIILCGDHNSMDRGFFDRNVDEDYQRHVYDCFVNAPVSTDRTKNRTFAAVDLFPTTLAALGCKIEGERLGLGTNLFSRRPTLAEELGFDRFNSLLAKSSDYYENNFYEAR